MDCLCTHYCMYTWVRDSPFDTEHLYHMYQGMDPDTCFADTLGLMDNLYWPCIQVDSLHKDYQNNQMHKRKIQRYYVLYK